VRSTRQFALQTPIEIYYSGDRTNKFGFLAYYLGNTAK